MNFRKLKFLNKKVGDILKNPSLVSEMSTNISEGDVYIIKKVFKENWIERLKIHLINVGQNSIPNYQSIRYGTPNFHRINRQDKRAYVQGCFHQFAFFPWNQDYFNLFKKSKHIYFLKNLLSGIKKTKFIGHTPDDNCIARISIQFYPAGEGFLNRHSDPVDYHQLVVPTLIMSTIGEDFHDGGAFFVNQKGKSENIEKLVNEGDVIFFNAGLLHGVKTIDKDCKLRWTDFKGRWSMLFAVNKLEDNSLIGNSIDLG